MGNPNAQINTAQEESSSFLSVLIAAQTGTDDAVLLFTAVANTGPGIVGANPATGSIVTVTRRGVYSISASLPMEANETAATGISLNVAAAGLATDPVLATAGMLQAGVTITPAATTAYISHATCVVVTEVAARAGAIFRGHATNNGDNLPAAGTFTLANCGMRVTRLADALA